MCIPTRVKHLSQIIKSCGFAGTHFGAVKFRSVHNAFDVCVSLVLCVPKSFGSVREACLERIWLAKLDFSDVQHLSEHDQDAEI